MKSTLRPSPALGAGLFLCLLATDAAAADGPAADAAGTPAIVVTARRQPEEAGQVPLSLAVLPGERLDLLRIDSVGDLAGQVPGLTMARSFRGPPIFTLRGIGFNSQNMSATSPVGFYLDEMALPYPVMSEGLLYDLERVEVLKGPQGTLFGRNTTGGLVQAIAARPTREFTGRLQASGGSHESYGVQGAVSGPLGETLSARLAFRIDRADRGWQRSVTRGDRLGRRDKAAARLALRWQPDDGTDLLLTGNWWRDRSETQAPQSVEVYPPGLVALGFAPADWPAAVAALGLPADFLAQSFRPTRASQANWVVDQLPWGGSVGGRNFTPAPLDLRKDNAFRSLSLRGTFRLAEGLRLETLSSHARFRRDEVTDNAGWAFESAITRGLGTIRSLSQEARLVGTHGRLGWVAGAIWSQDRVTDRDQAWAGTSTLLQVFRIAAWQAAIAAGADLATQEDVLHGFRDYANDTRHESDSVAAYAQAEFRPLPALGVSLGLRHTRDRTRFSGCSRDLGDNALAATLNAFYNGIGLPSAVAPGGCSTFLADFSQGRFRDRLAEDNLSGRLAIDWRPAPGTMLYASAARGYKSGAFPNIEGNFAVQYEPARQERVWTFEAGVKSRALPWLTLEAAAFRTDYRDKQVFGGIPDPVFGSLARVLNVPRSHVLGIEASFAAQPAPRLVLDASLAWLRTRIDRFTGLDDFGATHDFAGASFVYTPRLQFAANLTRGFALAGGWEGSAIVSWRHSSAQKGDLLGDPRFRIRPSDTIDAALTVLSPGGGYEIGLHVRNLADSYAWNAVHLQADSFARFAAPPRTWSATLTRNF
jgi:outer membrane receptor protein involved in Fe transport